MIEIDETSLLVRASAEVTVAELDEALAPRGLRLPLPPGGARDRTLAALLTLPSPADAAPRFGPFVRACVAIEARLHDGAGVASRAAPRRSTGPDWIHAFIGAENA